MPGWRAPSKRYLEILAITKEEGGHNNAQQPDHQKEHSDLFGLPRESDRREGEGRYGHRGLCLRGRQRIITDPIYFKSDIRVTIQDLGWRPGRQFLPLMDDISSVAYWYSDTLEDVYPPLPRGDALEIN